MTLNIDNSISERRANKKIEMEAGTKSNSHHKEKERDGMTREVGEDTGLYEVAREIHEFCCDNRYISNVFVGIEVNQDGFKRVFFLRGEEE